MSKILVITEEDIFGTVHDSSNMPGKDLSKSAVMYRYTDRGLDLVGPHAPSSPHSRSMITRSLQEAVHRFYESCALQSKQTEPLVLLARSQEHS